MTRALVYGTIGVLAGRVALGMGGKTTDTHGAIEEIGSGTFGLALLGAIAVGFAGYALWRFVQAIFDTDDKGSDLKGAAVRFGYFCSGLVNAALSFVALRLFLGGREGDGSAIREWTGRVLLAPIGPVLVGAVGAGVICFGLYQFYKAFSEKFRKRLETTQMNGWARKWAIGISKVGLSARGIIYCLSGAFLIRAALKANPGPARDPGEVLREVALQPYGRLMLGTLAFGFLAYAVYALMNAFYRRITV